MISTPPRKFVSPKSSPSNESYFGTVSELTDDGCTDEELSKEDDDFYKDIMKQAKDLQFFDSEPKANMADATGAVEYNVLKSIISAPILLATAPVVCAIEEANKTDNYVLKPENFVMGFGKGVVRGLVGSVGLLSSGLYTSFDQIQNTAVNPIDAPGQGEGFLGNLNHLLSRSSFDLAFNRRPESFEEELESLVARGVLKPFHHDSFGNSREHRYQFFLTDDPEDALQGLNRCGYNMIKGVASGVTYLLGAPVKDMVDGYNEEYEEGRVKGFEGAFRGIVGGSLRGLAGLVILPIGGVAHGVQQFARGATTVKNIPKFARLGPDAQIEFTKLTKEPLMHLLLQKGKGLEQYLEAEKLAQLRQEEGIILDRERMMRKYEIEKLFECNSFILSKDNSDDEESLDFSMYIDPPRENISRTRSHSPHRGSHSSGRSSPFSTPQRTPKSPFQPNSNTKSTFSSRFDDMSIS